MIAIIIKSERYTGHVLDKTGSILGGKDLDRVQRQVKLARKGRPLGVFEPQPGHVRLQCTKGSHLWELDVPMADAVVEAVR